MLSAMNTSLKAPAGRCGSTHARRVTITEDHRELTQRRLADLYATLVHGRPSVRSKLWQIASTEAKRLRAAKA